MRIIELPDGSEVEFPDDMSDSAIANALSSMPMGAGAGRGFVNPPVDTGRRELPADVTPSTAGAGRGVINPPVPDTRGLIERAGAWLRPEFKSVLETQQPTPEDEQADIDRRLGYGAGPVSRETVALADAMRMGAAPMEKGPALTVAKAREAQGAETFGQMAQRVNHEDLILAEAERSRRQAFAAENPIFGSVASGSAGMISGTINIPGVVADAFNQTFINPALQAAGLAPLARVPTFWGTEYLGKTAGEFLPSIGKKSMVGAWRNEEFTPWLMSKLAANSPQIAMQLIAAFAPPLRAAMLPGMAGTAAGQSYAQGDDSRVSIAKGVVEYATEKAPLQAFDKIGDLLKGLSPAKTNVIGAIAGQRVLQAGGAITANGIVNSIEETLAQFGGNVLDRYFQGKDLELSKGLAEAAVVGAATGKAMSVLQVADIASGRYDAPEIQIAREIDRAVANNEFTGADTYARRALDVQSYDENIISPTQTAKVQTAQLDLDRATDADEIAKAAETLAGSVDEMLVPSSAVTPLPPTHVEPTLAPIEPLGTRTAPIEPLGTRTAPIEPLGTSTAPIEPLGTSTAPIEPKPAISETERRYGLDKLRMTAPRPQKIQGVAVSQLSDEQLVTISADETASPISRRGAAIELTGRQGDQVPPSAAVDPIPIPTPPAAVAAPVEALGPLARTYTPAELGRMTVGTRKTLAQSYDQSENEDGSVTFTQRAEAPAVAEPITGGFVSIPGPAPLPDASDTGLDGLPDPTRSRERAQRASVNWGPATGIAPFQIGTPAPEQDASVRAMSEALSSPLGGNLVAFNDPSPTAPNGFAWGKVAYLNTATDVSAPFVAFHENYHLIEQIANAETSQGITNTAAQKFVADTNAIFDDMTPDGKRVYAEGYLYKNELAGISDPVAREQHLQTKLSGPLLRSEMTADFFGNRGLDREFLGELAKADPVGFKGFVTKWINILDNLIGTLKGKSDQGGKQSLKVDQHLRDLQKAKMIARDALVEYRGRQQPVQAAPALSMAQQGVTNGIDVTARSQVPPDLTVPTGQVPSVGGGGAAPRYGTARSGAISVTGRHYSTAPRQSLSGAYYGRGLKGAERDRLDSSPDPRLKSRIYFYVDKGQGIRPESGVGAHAHEAQLDNIYDPETRLIKPQADFNSFESAVINAGFDGYIAPFGTGQSAVVLLGNKHHSVPVRSIGSPEPSVHKTSTQAPLVLKKSLTARELAVIDTSFAPGARVRMGNLEIPADQVDAANAELKRIGSDMRFSAKEMGSIGEHEVQTQKDGTLKVFGDPNAIRSLMPEGVVGRPTTGGLLFTGANAPRVRAALEGRNLAYSRAGAVLDRMPVKNGKYLGAPENHNTPAKIPTLRRWLRRLVDEGADGRYWYENSGSAVLRMVGGNVQEARRFVALLAIYSPKSAVAPNTTMAMRAWAQHKAGQPIRVGTKVADKKAQNAMDDVDAFWSGEKTGNFVLNLMRSIDPTTADKQGATIDMWMMRAGGYRNDAPTATQYAFMENEINRLARDLGWEPQQVQAAIWVAVKARMENRGVKKATDASSVKAGWMHWRGKERAFTNEQAHRDNWLKHAFKHDPTKDDTKKAVFDFGDGLRRHIGQLSFEARPGRTTGVLPGIHDAPYDQQVEFQQAVQNAFLDENGVDTLAQMLGLLVDESNIMLPGVWQSEVSPSSQKLVAMAQDLGGGSVGRVDPAQHVALNVYASVAGLVARQEGVGWHRPFYSTKKSDSNGLDLDLGRIITPGEASRLESAIGVWMENNGKDNWQEDMALISSTKGIRIVSFGIIDNRTLQSEIVKVAEAVLPDGHIALFKSDGYMPRNKWKENPNGETYIQGIRASGRSDVLDWARAVLAPRIQGVFTDFSERYRWGDPGTISFSRRQEEDINTKLEQKIFSDFDAAVDEYARFDGAREGRLLDTDIARNLSPEYRVDRTRAPEVHDAASAFTQRAFEERMALAPDAGMVVFTAGGGGSGKTSADNLLGAAMSRANTILDGTLSNYDKARSNIQLALDNNQIVQVAYVYREPVDALIHGVFKRAMDPKNGRSVPLDAMVKGHVGSSATVRALAGEFGDNPRFNLTVIDNSRGKGNATISTLGDVPIVRIEGLKERLQNATDEEYAAGRISEKVYTATKTPYDTRAGEQGTGQREGVRPSAQGDVQERGGPVGPSYSLKEPDPKLERWAQDIFNKRGDIGESKILFERLPHPALAMGPGEAFGEYQKVILDGHALYHVDKRGHTVEGVTAQEVGQLPAALKNPRMVDFQAPGQALVMLPLWNDKGEPIVLSLKKDTLKGGGTVLRVTRFASAYPYENSASRVIQSVTEGNRVWLPSEEVSRLRDLLGRSITTQGADRGQRLTQTLALPLAGRGNQAVKVFSVLSNAALDKKLAGEKGWEKETEDITVPNGVGDRLKAEGVAFSRKQQPVGKETEGWVLSRDETGRLRFGAGAKAYRYVADVANVVLDVVAMKPVSQKLSRSMRKMKVEIEKAQNLTADVAKNLKELPKQEREMISDLIEGELKAGVIPPKRVLDLAASMQSIMAEQTAELVRLGMLSPDAAARWDGKYLPRFYEQKLGDEVKSWAKAAKALLGRQRTMQGIGGSSLKARGLFQNVPVEDIADWAAEGWEKRDDDFNPGVDTEMTMWRDFTRDERDDMGEIRDSMFRFVMGYNKSQRDIALGRLYEALSTDYASKREQPGYVRVPGALVEDTKVPLYGKLANKWVPKEVLDQLTAFDQSRQNDLIKLYLKGLSLWKEGKVVLNPVSHANNVLSNLTMAHFAGVSYWDSHKYIGAIRDLVKGGGLVDEAKEAGLFGGTFNRAELLKSMPEELRAMAQVTESAVGKNVERVWNALTLFLRKPMGAAYDAEDQFFRYLIYRDARAQGLAVDDAVDYSTRFIFTYDDIPKGARTIRDAPIGLPFFSYTYKVIPALAQTALEHPERYAAPAVALYVANAVAYAMAASLGGDDDESLRSVLWRYLTDEEFRKKTKDMEKQERKNLPEWMKGASISLGTAKTIRLGTDDMTNLPVFMDVSRIFPGGDLFDAHSNAGGVPLLAPITPNNPILTTAYAMLANKDTFRGRELVDKNDTEAEAAKKRAEWAWKQFTPAITVGNLHFERAMNVIANTTGKPVKLGIAEYTGIDSQGGPVQTKYAAMQTFGIKARPIDLDTSERIQAAQTRGLINGIEAEINRLRQWRNLGKITEEGADAEIEKQRQKQQNLREGLTVSGDEKD